MLTFFLGNKAGYSKLYDPTKFGSSKFSVSFRVEGKSVGASGARILVIQYSTAYADPAHEIGRQAYNFQNSAITAPMTVSFDSIDMISGVGSIFIYVDTTGGADLYISEVVVCGGDSSVFRNNIQDVNLWPECEYAAGSRVDDGATTAIEDKIPVLNIASSTAAGHFVVANAVGSLAPGAQCVFGSSVYSSIADTSQIEIVFLTLSWLKYLG